MSLIRDALERARAESERHAAKRTGPLAPAPVPPRRERSGLGLVGWRGLLAGTLFGALAAGAVFLIGGRRPSEPLPAESAVAVPDVAPAIVPAPAAEKPASAVVASEVTPPPAPPEKAAASGEAPSQRDGPPTGEAASSVERPTGSAAEVDAGEQTAPPLREVAAPVAAPPPSAAAAPAVQPGTAPAPRAQPSGSAPQAVTAATGTARTPAGALLDLGGIAFSPTGAVALINGKPLLVGEGLVSERGEAFLVERIDPDQVTLVSAGVRIVLTLR